MSPGGATGGETDGEGPLKHSVMKRSTVNSLVQLAFQMNPARAPCLTCFRNSHLMCFYKCFGRAAADATFEKKKKKLFANMTNSCILHLGTNSEDVGGWEGGAKKQVFRCNLDIVSI